MRNADCGMKDFPEDGPNVLSTRLRRASGLTAYGLMEGRTYVFAHFRGIGQ